MSEESKRSALQRMVETKRSSSDVPVVTPKIAMEKAFARAAQVNSDLVVSVTRFSEDRLALNDLTANLGEDALMLVTNGVADAVGLVVIDPQVVAGLVEQATMGRVLKTATEPRTPTATDGIIVSDFLDRVFEVFDRNLVAAKNAPPVSDFRCNRVLHDARQLSLTMEEMPYRAYRVTLDLAEGAKTGELIIYYPWFSVSAEQQGQKSQLEWREKLANSVADAEVSLKAILFRTDRSYASIVNWQEGDQINIPLSALSDISVEGENGRKVGRAKLGQCLGMRAIRIMPNAREEARPTTDEDFARSLPSNVAVLDAQVTEIPKESPGEEKSKPSIETVDS